MKNGFETQFAIEDPTRVVDAVAMWLEQIGVALTSSNCDLMEDVVTSADVKDHVSAQAMRVWSVNEILADKLSQMAALLSETAPKLTAKGAVQ